MFNRKEELSNVFKFANAKINVLVAVCRVLFVYYMQFSCLRLHRFANFLNNSVSQYNIVKDLENPFIFVKLKFKSLLLFAR